jgi:adenylate cyclase
MVSVGAAADDSVEIARTKRLFTGLMWISLPIATFATLQFAFAQSAPEAALALAPAAITVPVSLLVIWRWPQSYPNIAHLMIGAAVFDAAVLVVLAGGLFESGANSVWAFLGVLLAVVIFADWRATMWLVIFLITQAAAIVWASNVEPVFEVESAAYVTAFNLFVAAVMTYFIIYYYARQRSTLLAESDGLLRNILPAEIAERLKTSSDTIADDFDQASVLFADVVDFTPMSATLDPKHLVGLLDEVFSAIDSLVDDSGVEKIKTIGDAYMVAAGVPHARDDHAAVLCDLALSIRELAETRTFGDRQIRFRIGINSGPIVAGIIGTKKFSYDLWGNTVNIASRMESHALDGTIQISDATRRLVDDSFDVQPLGVIEVKGAGEMSVFALTGRKDATR